MLNLCLIGYTWDLNLIETFKRYISEGNLRVIYASDIEEGNITKQELDQCINISNVIIIDIRGGGKAEEIVYDSLFSQEDEKIVIVFFGSKRLLKFAKLGGFKLGDFLKDRQFGQSIQNIESMWERIKRIENFIEILGKLIPFGILKDAKSYVQILKYIAFPCTENYENLFKLLNSYLGIKTEKIKPAKEFPEYGIYHPEYGIFKNIEDYLSKINIRNLNKTKKIGILFHGGIHLQQNIKLISNLLKSFDDFLCIPVYTNGIKNLTAIKTYFFLNGRPLVDGILRLLWFRLNGGPFGGEPEPTVELLNNMNVPVFSPVVMYRREIGQWKDSDYGLSTIETIADVIWPEMDGSIEPIPIAGLKEFEMDGIKYKELLPIDERIKRVQKRITYWNNLRSKNNGQKRVAIIIYNYPPGEENLGKAAYLDVFQSLKILINALKTRGYHVNLPEDIDLFELFEKHALFNSAKWLSSASQYESIPFVSKSKYEEMFSKLPEKTKEDMIKEWSQPPGEIMIYKNKIMIPHLEFGNVLIGIQPARVTMDKADINKVIHDKTKPPHHQYLAFYLWLEEEWKADVVVHLGTHGLAEFTKGKEIGMSNECFPDLLIGNLPNLYFYHVLNTSEATIAKRRLYGCLISYNSPPYTTSDLYEDYQKLEDYLNEYEESKNIDKPRAKIVKEKIFELANKLNIQSVEIEEIHDEIYRLKRSIIPKGLHVVGKNYGKEDLLEFMKIFSRYDRENLKSLNRILAEKKGYSYDSLLKERQKNIKILSEIDREASVIIENYVNNTDYFKHKEKQESFYKEIIKTCEYAKKFGELFIKNTIEIQSFIEGLEGCFVEPSIGGDVIRSPEVLPTGRNIYQFDPNKIPSESAYIRGAEIAENTLEIYLKINKNYPESVGIILWGFETTQTHGETIGQILKYLGVKITKKFGTFYPELEIIPLSELGRPRIDCNIHTCGFFREMFPNIMLLLDKAFNLVSNLDEPPEMNFIKKHTLKNFEILKNDIELRNLGEEQLMKIATGRIFGPPPSEYGTRLLRLVEDSAWEKEEDLSDAFVQSMNYLYAENIHGLKVDKIYRENLKRIDTVSQIRSSNDYEISDLDHYYEFFGGLSKSVETERGKKPLMLITDTTQEVILTGKIDKFMEHGVRTRLLNPKWINEMLKHKTHGAQKIADIVENTLGWSATTGEVKNWIWDEIANRYCFNEEIKKKLIANNKWAAKEVFEKLLESNMRGYWKTNEENIEKIKNLILELEGLIEDVTE